MAATDDNREKLPARCDKTWFCKTFLAGAGMDRTGDDADRRHARRGHAATNNSLTVYMANSFVQYGLFSAMNGRRSHLVTFSVFVNGH